ncbi:MAG: NlpC/P60 family protein [Candidatus Planktophila sp.]|jgi:peptidoglycan DL-endopeptidase CwlO
MSPIHRLVRRFPSALTGVIVFNVLAICAPLISALPADAAQTLAEVQARVRQLEEEATTAAEGAQSAKVNLASLNLTLAGIQAKAEVQAQSVDSLSKTLSTIAIEQYKNGGLSQSLELLFSSDPALYLSAAGSLEALTRKKAAQLRKFQAAKQRLTATSLTVNDKLALVAATEKRLAAQSAQAVAKLAEAESLLSKLKKEDRDRLARLAKKQEDADQKSSLAAAKKIKFGSGRASKALQFALKQIGDKYVFGAAGMIYWDCSGLTMRAFQIAGVSLPHSSRAQYGYGKYVSRSNLAPGDLIFFGRPISHVGIYLGKGQMVHAPRSGSRVKIASAYNLGPKPYIGARRL